jgi:hypothetical protein
VFIDCILMIGGHTKQPYAPTSFLQPRRSGRSRFPLRADQPLQS